MHDSDQELRDPVDRRTADRSSNTDFASLVLGGHEVTVQNFDNNNKPSLSTECRTDRATFDKNKFAVIDAVSTIKFKM